MFKQSLLRTLLTLFDTKTNFSFCISLLFKKVSCPLSRCQLVHCQAAGVVLWKKGVRRPLTPQKLAQFGELEAPSIQQRRTSVSLSKVEFTQCPGEMRNFWILCSIDRLQPNTVSPAKSPSLFALQKQRPHGLKLMKTLSDASNAGCIAVPPLTRKRFSYLRSNFGN